MYTILVAYILYSISRFFSGCEDGLVSITEIELAKSRSFTDRVYKKEEDTDRRSLWHKMGAYKNVFLAAGWGIAMYGFDIKALYTFFILLSLHVVIFNPIIAVKYLNQKFFYISSSGLEGYFKGKEILYYMINLILALTLIFLEIKEYV